MLTEEQFSVLLQRPESETLDFKQEGYNLSRDDQKFAFIKDVLCMANTPRNDDSHIVLGVKKYPDGKFDLLGLDSHVDEADLQSQFSERVHPVPRFSYELVFYQGNNYGVVSIPPERIGPYVPIKDYGNGNFLRQRQIYFRRGSKNDVADSGDVMRIANWINSDDVSTGHVTEQKLDSLEWGKFVDVVQGFATSRRYLLVANIPESTKFNQLETVGAVNWSFVIDLDPQSDRTGLLKEVSSRLEARRHIHLVKKGDRPTSNLDRGTYWFFTRGLADTGQPVELGTWRDWRQEYGNELREQIVSVARASMLTPVTVIALWYGERLSDHLQSILDDILAAYGGGVDFVIATDNPADVQAVAARMDCSLISIPLHHICSGLEALLVDRGDPNPDKTVLPSSSGAPIALDASDANWIEEEIELVHTNAGVVGDSERDIGRDFLRGNEITWYELGLRYDVERDQTQQLLGQVHRDLSARRGVRINLYHAPGAGGTTVARRIIWDLHRSYPCGILRRTAPRETIERLQRVVTLTGQPAVILADGGDVSGRELDELFEYIKARHLPIVILQVLRTFEPQTRRERTFFLNSQLSAAECQRFAYILSREAPQRTAALDRVVAVQPDRFRTPFYYCLQAFGEDFIRLDSYVGSRLDELTEVQRKMLGILAIAHHYGQKSVPAQAFGHILGIPANRRVNLPESLSDKGLDLVVSQPWNRKGKGGEVWFGRPGC